MIYEKETWDRKTQAMGQLQKISLPEDDATIQGLEEDSPNPGTYVAHCRFILRAYIPK